MTSEQRWRIAVKDNPNSAWRWYEENGYPVEFGYPEIDGEEAANTYSDYEAVLRSPDGSFTLSGTEPQPSQPSQSG